MSAESKKSPKAPTPPPEGGNIENIRDILFGSQMRQYERRFQRLEELVTKEFAEVRSEVKRRLDGLETFAKQELRVLGDRVTVEREERAAAVAELGQRLTDLASDSKGRTTRLEESLSQAIGELRQSLLEQGKSLSDEIRSTSESLSARMGSGLEALRVDKVDRGELGSLLTEVAVRLNEGGEGPESRGQ